MEIKITGGESKQRRSIRSFERWLACLLSGGGGGFYDGENKWWGEYLCLHLYLPRLQYVINAFGRWSAAEAYRGKLDESVVFEDQPAGG